MPISADLFKQGLSHWASGVTVITYEGGGKKGGITVSSFNSVSLDPPLVLFCLAEGSQAWPAIEASASFGVNILSSEQKQISADFASGSLDKATVLETLAPFVLETKAPLLPGALANLDCRLETSYIQGDHRIVIGRVESGKVNGGEPLLYFNRNYRMLQ